MTISRATSSPCKVCEVEPWTRTWTSSPVIAPAAGKNGHAAGEANGLSGREVEVLRLIAEGRSNAGIAEALVISHNTVIRHVSNIFAKTGAANRTEAARYAHRHGLT